jgi:hypothetical protein
LNHRNTSPHPNLQVLEAFALGRLDDAEMDRVEGHLITCVRCSEVVLAAPDDALVHLLRRAPGDSAPGEDDAFLISA